ncbi:MAG: aminotransferase class IV [Desulfovibrio sp.]|nr:aminotransferase class IV [Desulfovibrio sp.]
MPCLSREDFLARLLAADRPGAETILAFYDSTADAICRDGRCCFIPLSDHLCHRGDALFESVSVRGGIVYALDGHMERLRKGAESFMRLQPPCSWEDLRRHVLEVAQAAGEPDFGLRIFLGRGAGGFGISPAECPRSSLYIVAVREQAADPLLFERGVTAFASRVPPKQAYLATVKNTNYLPNVLMAREAAERGMDVAVTFHEDGTMGEAAVANIGIVSAQGELVCPPTDRILAGTSMLCALEVARTRMPVRQADVTRDDIACAREMLLFASSKLCVGIVRFEDRVFGDGTPGPAARWLRQAMREAMIRTGVRVGAAQ